VLPHSQHQPLPGKAPIVMFEHIQQQFTTDPGSGRVQLICTGALTNAALLLTLFPEVKPMIEITIMGGAMGVGVMLLVGSGLHVPGWRSNVGLV
jgi:inosine-uridine nucleoside N-ribohydrolase